MKNWIRSPSAWASASWRSHSARSSFNSAPAAISSEKHGVLRRNFIRVALLGFLDALPHLPRLVYASPAVIRLPCKRSLELRLGRLGERASIERGHDVHGLLRAALSGRGQLQACGLLDDPRTLGRVQHCRFVDVCTNGANAKYRAEP